MRIRAVALIFPAFLFFWISDGNAEECPSTKKYNDFVASANRARDVEYRAAIGVGLGELYPVNVATCTKLLPVLRRAAELDKEAIRLGDATRRCGATGTGKGQSPEVDLRDVNDQIANCDEVVRRGGQTAKQEWRRSDRRAEDKARASGTNNSKKSVSGSRCYSDVLARAAMTGRIASGTGIPIWAEAILVGPIGIRARMESDK